MPWTYCHCDSHTAAVCQSTPYHQHVLVTDCGGVAGAQVVDPAHVPDVGEAGLKSEVDASAAYLKESPPLPADHPLRSAPGAPVMLPAEEAEILLPGEAEQHRMATR